MIDEDNYHFDKAVYTKLLTTTVKHNPYSAPYLFYLQQRAKIKFNFQSIIGEQGSGKSYWAIIENMMLDPTFTIDRIIFSTMNFLESLDTLEDRVLKGRCLMWDDAGVGLPSDEWYSISNRVIRLVQQTVRTLHPTIKFTMPDLKYLDAGQRRVLTCILDCIRKEEDRTKIRVYTKKRMRIMDKSYHRKFIFRLGAMKLKYGEIRVKHLTEDNMPDIMKQYEIMQQKFKFETRQKLKKLLEAMREKELVTSAIDDYSTITLSDLEKKTIYEIYKDVFANSPKYLDNKRKIDEGKLMLEHKCSQRVAKFINKFWKKKFTPDMVKDELLTEILKK